ncbi:hypothetical protein Misp06_03112 [Microbulbifer sp. NBRC 101763]|uniref:thioredoxin domain-containing protein n=1 Tax=Microbulbifer TaxID=48073 RepID=UPI00036A45E5|nr:MULTISPECIES: thioredoxin domain-containing protein [Microbulbifer]WHI52455.1 thioredoxin domain-containing protein [Microbulbifer sp. MLAF003]
MWKLKFLYVVLGALTTFTIFSGYSKFSDFPLGYEKTKHREIAARVGKHEISIEALDSELQFALYDIAEMQYELRLNKLHELIGSTGEGRADIEILLPFPQPPRIELTYSARNIRGNPRAPVTIAVFCSFQSPHCKSTQPVFRRLMVEYQEWIRQVNFDFPLKFHREGVMAAAVTRCAAEQSKFWEYHDALYTLAPSVNKNEYVRLAKQLQMDSSQFDRCRADGLYRSQVLEDQKLAIALGLKNVPVVFINGLYLKGPRTFEQYSFWIEKELYSLGINPKDEAVQKDSNNINERNLPLTKLPLRLLGISESSVKNRSKALIEVNGATAQYFTLGQALLEGVSLLRLYSKFAVIESNEGLAKLPLEGEEGTDILLTQSYIHSEKLKRRIEQPMGPGTRQLISPSGVLTLGQEWLSRQLEEREILESKFTEAELEVEGYHLMRLEGVADNEFFTALGFQENDVLLRVNDSWVHSGQNALWDALTSGKIIDVAFMRKGLPHRLQYVVEELGYFEEEPDSEKE